MFPSLSQLSVNTLSTKKLDRSFVTQQRDYKLLDDDGIKGTIYFVAQQNKCCDVGGGGGN